eukprot:TRINITY_DN34667_c0_g1_i1.p1 TRINITY_DN34667_c0_g1~~TRINITY_DN34667_c0_g1_i1.p1  ORF type:complete len:256 (+),score=28.10 TRINITY_DN34667_c0_g1_i1:89-856(+)
MRIWRPVGLLLGFLSWCCSALRLGPEDPSAALKNADEQATSAELQFDHALDGILASFAEGSDGSSHRSMAAQATGQEQTVPASAGVRGGARSSVTQRLAGDLEPKQVHKTSQVADWKTSEGDVSSEEDLQAGDIGNDDREHTGEDGMTPLMQDLAADSSADTSEELSSGDVQTLSSDTGVPFNARFFPDTMMNIMGHGRANRKADADYVWGERGIQKGIWGPLDWHERPNVGAGANSGIGTLRRWSGSGMWHPSH